MTRYTWERGWGPHVTVYDHLQGSGRWGETPLAKCLNSDDADRIIAALKFHDEHADSASLVVSVDPA